MGCSRHPTTTISVIFVLFTVTLHNVYGDCKASETVDYEPIPPENYDRNYTSITADGKYPLGFKKSFWYYNSAGRPDPCFKVTGATNRRLEIMFETFPSSRLCVMVQDTKICSGSGTGRLYRCIRAHGNDVVVEFECDSQCAEQDLAFWYRFVLGDSPENDPEDHWCESRDQDEYPENLRQLPFDFPFTHESTTPFNKAMDHSSSFLTLLIAMGSLLRLYL